MDLGEEWRARRWRRLLDTIDMLPRTSRFIEALSLDERYAEGLLDMEPANLPHRRLSEYSAGVEMLSTIADRLGELIVTVGATGGVRVRRIEPAPRPVTAMARVRERRRRTKHESLVMRMLPHKRPPGWKDPSTS